MGSFFISPSIEFLSKKKSVVLTCGIKEPNNKHILMTVTASSTIRTMEKSSCVFLSCTIFRNAV